MRLVGRPDLVEEPWFASAGERSRNGDLLDDAVAKWIAARPLSEVTAEFERVGAALAPIYDVEQLMNDPHVRERESITTVDDEDLGPLKIRTSWSACWARPAPSGSPVAVWARTTSTSIGNHSAWTRNRSPRSKRKACCSAVAPSSTSLISAAAQGSVAGQLAVFQLLGQRLSDR